MIAKLTAKLFLCAAGLVMWASVVTADMIPVLSGDLIGYRSTTNGLVATPKYDTGHGGLMIGWDITLDQGDGLFTYTYTFSRLNGGALTPGVSHALLELSTNITGQTIFDLISNPNFTISSDSPRTWTSQQGNPNLPGSLYGMKLLPSATGQLVFSFESPRIPVWGDFYVKGGNSSCAWNTGFGTDPTEQTTDFSRWVPIPDTANIPEPSALALAVGGLTLLGVVLRNRRPGQRK